MKRIVSLLILIISLNIVAQEKSDGPYVPANKELDAKWVNLLYQKGEQKVYCRAELTHLAMPCGGIGSGQVEITGEGNTCPIGLDVKQLKENCKFR